MRADDWRARVLRKACMLLLGIAASVCTLELVVRACVHVREVGPSFTHWHPEDGVQLRRSMDARRIQPEFEMRLRTNSEGFRGPEFPEHIERSVLFLGDSFTLGYGVADDKCFVSLLAARAPGGWSMVNAGIGGTGNGRWLGVLERQHERFSPRIVVLQVSGNDPDDNMAEALYSLDERGELVRHAPRPLSRARKLQALADAFPGVSYLRIVGLARQVASAISSPKSPPPASRGLESPDAADARASGVSPAVALTIALVRRAALRARELGAEPLLLECEPRPQLETALAGLAAELRIARVRAPRKSERPELYYRVDGHWNEAGHAAVADMIWEELQAPHYAIGAGRAR